MLLRMGPTTGSIPPHTYWYVAQVIKRHEGFRPKAYKDTVGVWTIGYGFTAGVKPGDTMTREEADARLVPEIAKAYADANELYPCLTSLDVVRQCVLIDLAFNLGKTKLSGFHNTNAAINASKWEAAKDGLTNSLWCRQVGVRCKDDTYAILNGKWPSELEDY